MKVKKSKMPTSKHLRKHLIRENSITKPANKVSSKRILMLTRRLNILMLEKTSLEEKNKDILDSLNSEKLLSASLRKDCLYWQRLYHEAELRINSYKVKQNELLQTMAACLKDVDALYPHFVALSDKTINYKIKLNSAINSVHTSDNGLPPDIHYKGKENECTRINGKPKHHHRVGPMVKGVLIKKPRVSLQRLMLPLHPEQEQVSPSNDPAVMEVNNLTPIPEEREQEENIEMRTVTVRPRHKLGRGWHLKRQAQLGISLERDSQRPNAPPPGVACSNVESSDSDCNTPAMNQMEPVVRIRDVSRLLQNSSVLKMDVPKKDGDGDGGGSNMRTPLDDPQEGSSWMFQSNANHPKKFPSSSPKCIHHSSVYKSDSSDDEDDNIIDSRNISNISAGDTLAVRNQSEIINSSADSVNVEPDSTNNIEDNQFSNTSDNSLGMSSSFCIPRNVLLNHSNSNSTPLDSLACSVEKIKSNMNSPTVRLSNVLNDSNSLSGSSRKSSGFNNCSPVLSSPDLGKRVRKPKLKMYPGEEKYCELPKQAKFTVGKKSSRHSTKSKYRKSNEKRLSSAARKLSEDEFGEPSTKKVTQKSVKPIQRSTEKKSISGKKNKRLSSSMDELSRGDAGESLSKKTKKKEPSTVSTAASKSKRLSSAARKLSEDEFGESSTKKATKKSVKPIQCSTEKKSVSGKKNKRLSSYMDELSREDAGESLIKKTKKKEPSTVSTAASKSKSSMKRSLYSSRTSSYGNSSSRPTSPTSQDAELSRPRRNRSNLNYRESPLNVKQRRP